MTKDQAEAVRRMDWVLFEGRQYQVDDTTHRSGVPYFLLNGPGWVSHEGVELDPDKGTRRPSTKAVEVEPPTPADTQTGQQEAGRTLGVSLGSVINMVGDAAAERARAKRKEDRAKPTESEQ